MGYDNRSYRTPLNHKNVLEPYKPDRRFEKAFGTAVVLFALWSWNTLIDWRK